MAIKVAAEVDAGVINRFTACLCVRDNLECGPCSMEARPMLKSIADVIGCYVLSIVLVLATDP